MTRIIIIIFLLLVCAISAFAVWAIATGKLIPVEAQEMPIAEPIAYNEACINEIETALAREAQGTASTFEQFNSYIECLNQLIAELKPNGKVRPRNVVLDKGIVTPQDIVKWHKVASALGKPIKDDFVDRQTQPGLIEILELKTSEQVENWLAE